MLRARTVFITATAVGLLALTGCSASGSAAGSHSSSASPQAAAQSTAEACAIMQKTVSASTADLQSALSTATTDPTGAVAKLDSLTAAMDASMPEVTNEKALAVYKKGDDAFKAMVEQVKKIQADPSSLDLTAYQATITDVQTSFSDIGKVCG